MTKDEFLKILEELEDHQEEDIEWMPAEPIAHEKINKYQGATVIDLTSKTGDQIKLEIHNATNFVVEKFKIKIYNYGATNKENTQLSLRIFEEKNKTHSGQPCSIDFVVAIESDIRFERATWKNKFKHTWGSNISFDELLDIVKWLQKINKFSYFT